jgi:hypothetical protein
VTSIRFTIALTVGHWVKGPIQSPRPPAHNQVNAAALVAVGAHQYLAADIPSQVSRLWYVVYFETVVSQRPA